MGITNIEHGIDRIAKFVEEPLKSLKTKGIKMLYTDTRVSEDAKPLIENELRSREKSSRPLLLDEEFS